MKWMVEALCASTSWCWNLILLVLMDCYEAGAGGKSAKHQAHQWTSIHWLVNSGAICRVLCWTEPSWPLNGCHEHGTDNGNGIRQRGNGSLSSHLRLCDGLCVCACVCEHTCRWTGTSPAAHVSSLGRLTCTKEYLQPSAQIRSCSVINHFELIDQMKAQAARDKRGRERGNRPPLSLVY